MGVYSFSPYAVPTALTTILILTFGIRVLVLRVSRVSASFFVLTFVVSVWLFAFTFMYSTGRADVAERWARIAYLGVPFIAPAIYQFTVEMLRIARHRRMAVAAAWLLGATFSVTAITTPLLVTRVTHYRWGYYPRYDPRVSIFFLAFFFGYLVAALGEFLLAHPHARGIERRRIRLLILAFGIAYIGSVDYLAKFGIGVYPFGYLPILGFVLVVAHTVRRYDLMPITPSLAANEIINTMGDVLFVCDRDGRIQFANEAARILLGFEAPDLIGLRIEDLISHHDGDEFSSTLRRRSIRSAEYEFRTKSGEKADLTLSISPVIYQGEAAGAVIIGRDMRERKRAEREVRRALTLLQSTLDSTADGILVIGEGGRILTYNQRFVDMWRIPPGVMDDASDERVLEFIREQISTPEEFMRIVRALYAQPLAESFDLLEFKDGRRFERYSIGRTIEGAPVRVWSFSYVTARFAAEAALRESEVRYRLLFELNAAGVCVTALDGTISDCNLSFAALLGCPRNELTGRNLGDFYQHRIERDEMAAMLRDTHHMKGVEIELRRKDGSRVWVLHNLALIGQGEGAMIHATVVDISDRKRNEEQIEYHAYHDVLTQLPNRRLFRDRLELTLSRAKRAGRPLAVMFIDLDHFKTINDTLGHNAGDELLLEMAARLKACVREEDTVARIGGDEFTIVVSDLRQPEDAIQVAQKILEAVALPLNLGGTPIEISASIGIALFPADGHEVETLLRNADSAMYRAKESGRNNYQLCTEDMKTRALERLSLETRLRKALQKDQLLLMYQPQVNLATGRIIGAEALVRWNDPDRGMIDPMQFIPIAEESRLIVPLGEWVLRAACRQAKEWHDGGAETLRVSVNLSARQFQQQDLAEMVERVIREAEVDPSQIELEITETTAMQNAEASIEILHALCDIGVAISIDDFGTGYSSLNYLKRFPITAVKIDRAFVNGVSSNAGDDAIVSAVIAIARSLRIRVVAEGVETEEQFGFLQRRQCDEAQGFYFSPPMTAEALTRTLSERPILGMREPRLHV
jgi:diguanylate cyclase (GGDEF)-like protein/PAS domain S-box-containing protein